MAQHGRRANTKLSEWNSDIKYQLFTLYIYVT